jgi:hypothetical protein
VIWCAYHYNKITQEIKMNEEEFIAQYYYQKKNGEDGNDISEK